MRVRREGQGPSQCKRPSLLAADTVVLCSSTHGILRCMVGHWSSAICAIIGMLVFICADGEGDKTGTGGKDDKTSTGDKSVNPICAGAGQSVCAFLVNERGLPVHVSE